MRRKTLNRATLVFVAGLVGSVSLEAEAQQWLAYRTKIRVARHSSVSTIYQATHETAFTNASTALQIDNGSNDIACDLNLELLDMYKFSGAGSTDSPGTQAEYQATQANSVHGYYVIVNTINWCLTTGAAGGCGWPQGGLQPFLVTRSLAVSSQRGIVLAHEYGHTVGLAHDNIGRQIMDPDVLTTTDNKVRTTSSCNVFRTVFNSSCPAGPSENKLGICTTEAALVQSVSTPATAVSLLDVEATAGHVNLSSTPIASLAARPLVHRISPAVEDFYGDADVRELRRLLRRPASDGVHRTTATLIGLISQDPDVDARVLGEYAESSGSDASAAMMALGYLVSRHRSEPALSELMTRFEQGGELRRVAALGLTLSGDPRAYDALTSAAREATDDFERIQYMEQARENERVGLIGIRAHYENPPAPVWLDLPYLGQGLSEPDPG